MMAGMDFHSRRRRTPNNQSTPFCSGMCQSSTMICGSVSAACMALQMGLRFHRAGGRRDHEAPGFELRAEDFHVDGAVVDHQHARARREQQALRRVRGDGRRGRQRDRQREGRAQARLADHRDVAAHERGELAADREPQARAAEAARGRAVFLHEGVEDRRLVLRQDAGAGVDHVDDQRHVRLGRIHAARADQHVAAGGELERVRHQVHEDLADAQLVALGPAMQVRIDVEQQLDALLVRALREQVDDFLDHLADVEILRFEAQLAGLDLREVENVVDDGEQRVGRALDGGRETALARIELGIEQQLGHAEHAVHRRADFVRHAREEFALGAAGRLGDAAGLDAVVHGLAQRAVGFGEALGALDRPAPRAVPAGAPAPARACSILPSMHVEAAHQRADFVVRGDLRAPRIVAALGGLHGVDQVEQRRGDLPLHAARQ